MHTLLSSVMVVHIHVQCPFMWSLPLLSLIDFNRRRPHTFTPCVSLCPSFSLCHKKGFSASEQEILVLEPVCRQLFEDNRTFLCLANALSWSRGTCLRAEIEKSEKPTHPTTCRCRYHIPSSFFVRTSWLLHPCLRFHAFMMVRMTRKKLSCQVVSWL